MNILATDMDGTFLDHLGSYDKVRLDKLLDACEAKNYVFTVASGRSLLALEELFDGFVDRIAIIAENGALVQYKGEVLFESKLEPKDYSEIVQRDFQTALQEMNVQSIVLFQRSFPSHVRIAQTLLQCTQN